MNVAWNLEESKNESPISIVLIHGFGACKEHWRNNQRFCGEISPCYAIDLIGFGESSQPKARLHNELIEKNNFFYCFENWSQQIADFCAEIVKKPVLLIGNSIGGIIAIRASQLLQNKCVGLVLIDCAQRTMDDKRLSEQPIGMQILRPILKSLVKQRVFSQNIFKAVARPFFIEKFLNIAYPTKNNLNAGLINMLYKPTQREGASEAFRGFINLFNDYLAPELLKDVNNVKVDLIWGEKDPWEPLEEANKWFKSIRNIQSLKIIKGCGHCPHDENPKEVNKVLLEIIQQAI